jgi:hypothetical protein
MMRTSILVRPIARRMRQRLLMLIEPNQIDPQRGALVAPLSPPVARLVFA